MEPLVSVIVPARNEAERIGEALDSLGDDPRLEILVIDDRSTDGTAAVVEARADPRIRILTTRRKVEGPGPTRNLGLEVATGTWVAFLDADDAWVPGRIDRLLETADLSAADFIADDILIEGDRRPTTLFGARRLRFSGPLRTLDTATFVARDLGTIKPLIRRSVIEAGPNRFGSGVTEDFSFLLRCLVAASNPILVAAPGYHYRIPRTRLRMSTPSPAFWLGAVQTTAELIATTPSVRGQVRRALEDRLRRQWRRYLWLQSRDDLRNGRTLAGLRRLVRTPSAILVAGEGRRRKLIRR